MGGDCWSKTGAMVARHCERAKHHWRVCCKGVSFMLREFHLNKAAWKLKTVSPKAQPQFSAAPAAQHLGRQVSTGNLPEAPSLPWLPHLPPHRTAGRGDRGPHSGGHNQHFHPTPCFTPSCRGQRRLHHTGRLWLGDRPAGARPSGEAVGGGVSYTHPTSPHHQD